MRILCFKRHRDHICLAQRLDCERTAQALCGTSDIRVNSGNPKDKRVNVRLTVSGVVPKKLIPEKKGVTTF